MKTKSLVLSLAAFVTLHASAATWQWTGQAGTGNWQDPLNWGGNITASFNGTFADRLDVNGTQELTYTAAEGTTAYGGASIRGLVVGSGTNGTMTISGGLFSSLNATGTNSADVIGNGNNATAVFNVAGGTFIGSSTGTSLGLGTGTGRVATMTVSGGNATVTTLIFNTGNGTLNLDAGTLTANSVSLTAGGGTFNFNGGTLKAGQGNATFLAGLTRANVRNGGAIIDTNSSNITIAQPLLHSNIDGDNATDGGLTKLGAGTLTLNGTSTYNGSTTISGGTLQLGAGGTTGALSPASAIGGTTGTLAFNRSNSLAQGTDFGVISGGIALTKAGAGTVTLNGTNSFTGSKTVTAGTLALLADQSAATGSIFVGPQSTTSTMTIGSASQTANTTVVVNAGNTVQVGQNGYAGSSFTKIDVNGAIANPTAVTNSGTLLLARNAALTVYANTSWMQSGNATLRNVGGYRPLLDVNGGSFTYGGAANFDIGFNNLLNDNSTPEVKVQNNGVFTTSRGFTLVTTTHTAPNYMATVTLTGGGKLALSADVAALTSGNGTVQMGTGGGIIDTAGFSTTIAHAISNVSAQTGSLTKAGAGTLTLTGNNTYNGTTTVTAGTLIVSGGGELNASSGITVSTGATLTNDTATALVPALALGEGSVLSGIGSFSPTAMTLIGNLADGFAPVTAGSTLTKAGALTFTLSGVTNGTYPLISGSPSGQFTSVVVGLTPLTFDSGDNLWKGTADGFDYAFSDSLNQLSVVPEPGTWILVGLGLTFLLCRKTRRTIDG